MKLWVSCLIAKVTFLDDNKMAASRQVDNDSKMSSLSADNPAVLTVKIEDVSSMIPASNSRGFSGKQSLNLSRTDQEMSTFAMDFEEFR